MKTSKVLLLILMLACSFNYSFAQSNDQRLKKNIRIIVWDTLTSNNSFIIYRFKHKDNYKNYKNLVSTGKWDSTTCKPLGKWSMGLNKNKDFQYFIRTPKSDANGNRFIVNSNVAFYNKSVSIPTSLSTIFGTM